MKNHLFLVLLLVMSGPIWAGERSSFCSNTVQDVYPDHLYSCEGLQSLKRGQDGHALEMFRKASKWGNKRAQFRVGLMHLSGIGTPVNVLEGTAWLLLANERNSREVSPRLAEAQAKLDDQTWRAASARAVELRDEFGDFAALERRDRWVRERKRSLTGSRTGMPMGTVKVVTLAKPSGLTGITGRQMLARLDHYVDSLQEVITTVEYRDFDVIESE